jgi:AraC-like DNA-binding protein
MKDFKLINSGQVIRVKKVADYAQQLGISQNYLNDTIKSITGKSAGQLIKDQLIKQATMCLKHSSKNVSEIAYLLGYEDPSYFVEGTAQRGPHNIAERGPMNNVKGGHPISGKGGHS